MRDDHDRTPFAVHERAHMPTAQIRATVAQRHLVGLHAGTFSAIGGNSLDGSFKNRLHLRATFREQSPRLTFPKHEEVAVRALR